MIKNIFLSLFLFVSFINAEEVTNSEVAPAVEITDEVEQIENNADCLILEDENSIICKYEMNRPEVDQQIKVEWISPTGEISRGREMLIPVGHGSVYDYRYISGRESGTWTFKVYHNDKTYSTQFELK